MLLHMENSIGLVDSSIYNSQVMIRSGSDAKLSTSEKKFGDSGLWSSNNLGIYIPSNPQNTLDDHDFTIEGFFWLYEHTKHYGHRIIGTYGSPASSLTGNKWLIAANGWGFGYGIIFYITDAYSANVLMTIYTTPFLDAMRWYHFAVVRNGNTFSLYLDGILVASQTVSQPIRFDTGDICLATSENDVGGQFSGYLDEIRIKKAVVYTGNFTVPTLPFSDS